MKTIQNVVLIQLNGRISTLVSASSRKYAYFMSNLRIIRETHIKNVDPIIKIRDHIIKRVYKKVLGLELPIVDKLQW